MRRSVNVRTAVLIGECLATEFGSGDPVAAGVPPAHIRELQPTPATAGQLLPLQKLSIQRIEGSALHFECLTWMYRWLRPLCSHPLRLRSKIRCGERQCCSGRRAACARLPVPARVSRVCIEELQPTRLPLQKVSTFDTPSPPRASCGRVPALRSQLVDEVADDLSKTKFNS